MICISGKNHGKITFNNVRKEEITMSQAKVDKYKQEKANREKIMKKERLIKRIEITVCAFDLRGSCSMDWIFCIW